jgi:ABC-type sugar transport system ATPase subunit
MVFQSYALYPNMNVAQNIAFGLEMRKVPKAAREAGCVERVATMLQIEHLLDRKPGSCPAASASAWPWAARWRATPSSFLFDEPLSNLDAKLRVEMRAEIKLLHQRTRTHHGVRHARPGRGDDAGRPHCGDEGRRGQQFGTPRTSTHGRPRASWPSSSARR